ncbi:MAG: tRNA threonylcarbamoyl adenosine modification protein YjeE [Acidimicrobiales bacterium]|nr:tRNA threonylcarbamoyl adenosine modification protein YjeE [Acidimicrobiales bacterium]
MTGYRTTSVDATRQLATAMATLAQPGDLLLLVGDLGAGKTAFTQGFAGGLGIDEPITSPTFTLARSYKGRMVLNHLDVYRLENVQEAEDLGLGELLEGGVTLIEWGDTIAPVLPADYLELRFTFGEDDDDRNLATRIVGPTWSARQRTITELLGPWAC